MSFRKIKTKDDTEEQAYKRKNSKITQEDEMSLDSDDLEEATMTADSIVSSNKEPEDFS